MLKNGKWQEKYREKHHSGVSQTDKGMMYISFPAEIDSVVKKVPKGKLTTTKLIADKLTRKYKVNFTCPLTTGIFLNIVANKTEEDRSQGKKNLTPYWRVVKEGGKLYDRYLGTPSIQKDLITAEGFKVERSKSGKNLIIKNYKEFLV